MTFTDGPGQLGTRAIIGENNEERPIRASRSGWTGYLQPVDHLAMLAVALLPALLPLTASATPVARWEGDSLAALAEKSGKYFGTAYQSFYLVDERYEPILNTQFDQYTHENELKWEIVQAERGVFNWTGADLVSLLSRTLCLS